MHAKRHKGRPKLPPDDVRRFMIGMTVTAEERRQIKTAAEAEDLSISAWMRRLAFEGLRKKVR